MEETGRILSYRYPDLVDQPTNSERLRALKDLENVFLKNDGDDELIASKANQLA